MRIHMTMHSLHRAIRPILLGGLSMAAFLATPRMDLMAQPGFTGAHLLRVEPDARTAGMGNAGGSLSQGDHAAWWNPALLAEAADLTLGLSHSNWLPGLSDRLTYDHIGATWRSKDIGTFAAQLTYFNLGEQTATDAIGQSLGRFSNYEMALGASWGRSLSEDIDIGAGLKWIRSSIAAGQRIAGAEITAANSLALDMGVLRRFGTLAFGTWTFAPRAGVALSSLGPGLAYMEGQQRTSLPTTLRLAGSVDVTHGGRTDRSTGGIAAGSRGAPTIAPGSPVHRLTLSSDITRLMARDGDGAFKALFTSWGAVEVHDGLGYTTLGTLEQFTFAMGLEYAWQEFLMARTGFYIENPDNGNRRYATLGAGARYQGFGVDLSYLISFAEHHPMANTLRISLKVSVSDLFRAPDSVQ